jgi:hypothetical protein
VTQELTAVSIQGLRSRCPALILIAILLFMPMRLTNAAAAESASPQIDIAPFNLSFGVTIADLNGDGYPDIAAAVTTVTTGPHPGWVFAIMQNPQAPGTFLTRVRYRTIDSPLAIAAGDLDGDGNVDLVVAAGDFGNIAVLMQDQSNPGIFLPQTRIHVGGYPTGLAIGDLNGDGKPDLAVAAGGGGVKILFNDPSNPGTFMPPVTIQPRGGSAGVTIADLDGDGLPDLVSVGRMLSVFMQDPAHPGNFLPALEYKVGAYPASVKAADLNGDGLPDLVVGNSSSISVLLQDPLNRGRFLPKTNYATGANTSGVDAADLDGDGRTDMVAANNGTLSTHGSVSVLLQRNPAPKKLVFGKKNYAGKSGPFAVAIGDLNGDGKPDIAVADGGAATVLFQRPDLPGRFFPPVTVGK